MVDPFLKNTNKQDAQINDTPASVEQKNTTQATNSSIRAGKKPIPPKKGLSIKTILRGCLGFGMLIVGLGVAVLYSMIQNPDQYMSIGLDTVTIQMLLQTFAVLFFSIGFFVGFGLLLVNGYKFVTVKNKPRLGYGIMSMIGMVVLLFSIGLGAVVLTRIADLDANRGVDASSLVIPYLVLQNGPTNIITNPDLTLIAPGSVAFQLNNVVFNRQVMPLLGQIDLQSVVLNCGNGNTLLLGANSQFDGACHYHTKGEYPIVLTVSYISRQTGETRSSTYQIGSLQFLSEITMRIQDGSVTIGQGELIAGQAPRKITRDAAAVFRDLGLPEYRIVWDVVGDGQIDAENVADVTWIYNEPRVYNMVVRFPGLNRFAYTFPFRIEQPDVPICILSTTQLQGTNYRIQADMTGRTARIDDYRFSIIDIADNRRVVGTQRATTNTIEYNFPGQGLYAVRLDFVTSDGRQGSCESLNFSVGQADFSVNYDIFFRGANDPQFTQITPSTSVYMSDGSLVVSELPTVIQLHIQDIQPVSSTANLSVFFNEVAILPTRSNIFEARIAQREGNRITITVDDPVRGANTQIHIPIEVEQAPIVGRLQIRPDTVGTDPFTVTFDASTTAVQDPDDEIVYFTWDFGDGTVRTNLSQSVITHTYRYDYENDNGQFSPSVQILTRRGRSLVIVPPDDILVKKAVSEVIIEVDSHPAQIAQVGDLVEFSVQASGLPTRIVRDFGNGNTLELPGRQGIGVSHTFDQAGDYSIKALIEYENQPSINATVVLRVQ